MGESAPGVLSYATPVALDQRGAWREGMSVVLPLGARLPDRCVRCNAPASEQLCPTFHYYATFELTARGSYRNLPVPLCADHYRTGQRRQLVGRLTLLAGGAMIGGFVVLALSIGHLPAVTGALTIPILAIGVVLLCLGQWLVQRAQPLRIRRATRRALYLKGAGLPFLDSLSGG